jgi:metal-sulfur cluster biosynthetic enzyme
MTSPHADQARHLMLIVRELRELGIDPEIVLLDDDGVTQTDMTLTDELCLIAFSIDFDAAMAISTESS